jgi:hypothetical protein
LSTDKIKKKISWIRLHPKDWNVLWTGARPSKHFYYFYGVERWALSSYKFRVKSLTAHRFLVLPNNIVKCLWTLVEWFLQFMTSKSLNLIDIVKA